MATIVPSPTLDTRDEDAVTAEAIASLPSELSNRSPSDPSVVIIEAIGALVGKLLFQLGQWPLGVVQKVLALCGVVLNDAAAATVPQSFTLSNPQALDTVIPSGTQVSTLDGSVVFGTTADMTIPAYVVGTGTVSTTIGSTTVTNSGSNFTTGTTWNGWQIQVNNTWYTISSVTNATTLLLTASASATVSGATWNVGPVTGSVTAKATTTGLSTNVGAGKLVSLSNAPAGVASTINGTAASGGADQETASALVARAPGVFATRDVACQAEDYATYAQKILGSTSRAKARANTNDTVATTGYVTLALLSYAWTTSSSASTLERAAVVRDILARSFSGATLIDVVANIQSFTPTAMFWRKSGFDENTVRANVAAAINGYLNPNTYDWGRTVYIPDMLDVIESAAGVDRVETLSGVPCLTSGATTTTANGVTFTNNNASATGTAGNFTTMIANRTVLIDATNKAAYLVTAIAGGTLTLDRVFAGATVTTTVVWFTVGETTLTNWYSLPYSALSVSLSSPAPTLVCVGAL